MWGTLDVFSSLAAQAGSQTVAQFGEDRVFDTILRGFAIHNRITRQIIAERVEFTEDRLRRFGGNVSGDMQKTDEYGTPDVQKHITGANQGFPLDYWTYGVQWTRKFLQNNTVRDLLKEANAARQAHIRRVQRELLRPFFKPTNDLTYEDELIDYVVLPIRALLNADGTPIPPNPFNGAEFNPDTHTHYLFATVLNDAAMSSLIATLQEHGVIGTMRVEIPALFETAVRALTNFVPLDPPNIIRGGGSTVTIARGALDQIDTTNRQIGTYGAAEVWVKPWAIAASATSGWLDIIDTGKPAVTVRTRPGTTPINLTVEYESETFPLRCRILSDEFGTAIGNRDGAAVMYIDPGAVAYVMPTIP